MSDNLQNPGQTKVEVEWPVEATATIYANVVAITQTPFDMSIFFGLIDIPLVVESAQQPSLGLTARPVAAVRLHPSTAKQLRDFLDRHIAAYEQQLGTIAKLGDARNETNTER